MLSKICDTSSCKKNSCLNIWENMDGFFFLPLQACPFFSTPSSSFPCFSLLLFLLLHLSPPPPPSSYDALIKAHTKHQFAFAHIIKTLIIGFVEVNCPYPFIVLTYCPFSLMLTGGRLIPEGVCKVRIMSQYCCFFFSLRISYW